MDSGEQSNGCYSWRSIGITLGWLGIVDSIGFGLFFILIFGIYMGLLHVAVGILIIYGLNVTASILWLFGVFNKNPVYLLTSLVWYAIPRSIMIFLAIILICGTSGIIDNNKQHDENIIVSHATNLFNVMIIGGAVYGVVFYLLSVICYIKIKADVQRYTSEIPRMDVAYTTAPDFDIY